MSTWWCESTGLSGGQSLTLSLSLPLSRSLSLSLSRSRLCSRSRSRDRSRFFRRLLWWEDDLELLCSDRCSCPLPGTWGNISARLFNTSNSGGNTETWLFIISNTGINAVCFLGKSSSRVSLRTWSSVVWQQQTKHEEVIMVKTYRDKNAGCFQGVFWVQFCWFVFFSVSNFDKWPTNPLKKLKHQIVYILCFLWWIQVNHQHGP